MRSPVHGLRGSSKIRWAAVQLGVFAGESEGVCVVFCCGTEEQLFECLTSTNAQERFLVIKGCGGVWISHRGALRDDSPGFQEIALEVFWLIEKIGEAYEAEHEEDLRKTKQYGACG